MLQFLAGINNCSYSFCISLASWQHSRSCVSQDTMLSSSQKALSFASLRHICIWRITRAWLWQGSDRTSEEEIARIIWQQCINSELLTQCFCDYIAQSNSESGLYPYIGLIKHTHAPNATGKADRRKYWFYFNPCSNSLMRNNAVLNTCPKVCLSRFYLSKLMSWALWQLHSLDQAMQIHCTHLGFSTALCLRAFSFLLCFVEERIRRYHGALCDVGSLCT